MFLCYNNLQKSGTMWGVFCLRYWFLIRHFDNLGKYSFFAQVKNNNVFILRPYYYYEEYIHHLSMRSLGYWQNFVSFVTLGVWQRKKSSIIKQSPQRKQTRHILWLFVAGCFWLCLPWCSELVRYWVHISIIKWTAHQPLLAQILLGKHEIFLTFHFCYNSHVLNLMKVYLEKFSIIFRVYPENWNNF